MTDGKGYDLFVDCVGDDVFDAAIKGSARSARLLIVGFAGGRAPSIPAGYLLAKNLSVIPVAFGGDFAESPKLAREVIDDLGAMHAKEPFHPEITEYGLSDVPKALDRLRNREVRGKQVIVTGYTPD